MHHSPSVHFCCCALPPSSHLKHTQQPPFLLCSTFLYSLCTFCMRSPSCSCILYRLQSPPHRGVFSTLLFHSYPISCVPHSLTLFCISCSFRVLCLIIMVTLQLLCQFPHASIITGCYLEIPQLLWQLRLFVFSVIDELILWQKPSFVSSSYTVRCNSSPPIFSKFICTIELTSLNLAFISPFRISAFWDPRGEYFITLQVPIPETPKWSLPLRVLFYSSSMM
jgi:hypothetical protein